MGGAGGGGLTEFQYTLTEAAIGQYGVGDIFLIRQKLSNCLEIVTVNLLNKSSE